jgi:hypothetical protein
MDTLYRKVEGALIVPSPQKAEGGPKIARVAQPFARRRIISV